MECGKWHAFLLSTSLFSIGMVKEKDSRLLRCDIYREVFDLKTPVCLCFYLALFPGMLPESVGVLFNAVLDEVVVFGDRISREL